MECRWTPRWHVQRFAHPRHVRATETGRALNRSARDSDTRGFHRLSNGSRLCWLLLLQESTSHKLRQDVRRYRHCSGRCSGSGVWPPDRGPRKEEVPFDPLRGGRQKDLARIGSYPSFIV